MTSFEIQDDESCEFPLEFHTVVGGALACPPEAFWVPAPISCYREARFSRRRNWVDPESRLHLTVQDDVKIGHSSLLALYFP